jgi:hypothetical protein
MPMLKVPVTSEVNRGRVLSEDMSLDECIKRFKLSRMKKQNASMNGMCDTDVALKVLHLWL